MSRPSDHVAKIGAAYHQATRSFAIRRAGDSYPQAIDDALGTAAERLTRGDLVRRLVRCLTPRCCAAEPGTDRRVAGELPAHVDRQRVVCGSRRFVLRMERQF